MDHWVIVDPEHDQLVSLLELGACYPVWSPLEAYDAAAALMAMLETDEDAP